MKKTFYKILATTITLFVLVFPLITSAAGYNPQGGSIVPNCTHSVTRESKDASGRVVSSHTSVINACGYTDLIQLGINVMGFAIYMMAILSVISFVYAGFLYMSSGGDSGALKKAHAIFEKVAFGIFFTLGAWLIVHQITVWLGVTSAFTLLQ